MFKKWYFGILTTAWALLVMVQQNTVVANQEIVLEFANVDINSPEAQRAIALVKNQLRTIGVKNPQLSQEFKNGKLKITYYIDSHIASVKRILSATQSITFDLVLQRPNEEESPTNEKDSKEYTLTIYEVQKRTDRGSNFIVNQVLELHKQQDEQPIFDTYHTRVIGSIENSLSTLQTVQKIGRSGVLVFDHNFPIFPEIRAGPFTS